MTARQTDRVGGQSESIAVPMKDIQFLRQTEEKGIVMAFGSQLNGIPADFRNGAAKNLGAGGIGQHLRPQTNPQNGFGFF